MTVCKTKRSVRKMLKDFVKTKSRKTRIPLQTYRAATVLGSLELPEGLMFALLPLLLPL